MESVRLTMEDNTGGPEKLTVGALGGSSSGGSHFEELDVTGKEAAKLISSKSQASKVNRGRPGGIVSLDFPEHLASDWPDSRAFGAEKKGRQKNHRGTQTLSTHNLVPSPIPIYNGFSSSCQHLPPLPSSGMGWRERFQDRRCSLRCHQAQRGARWPALPGSRPPSMFC